MEKELKTVIISQDELLASGVYFGHRKALWNPKAKPFISLTRKGIHIINVKKTLLALNFAYRIIKSYAEKGAKFVFIGTKKQAKDIIRGNAIRTDSFYVDERWLGGTLTNSKTIFQRVKYMESIEKKKDNNYEGYTKKEGILFDKQLEKLHRNLQGIRKMFRKPQIMIVADCKKDLIAIKEAKKMGVKVIGIVDTNVDPNIVDIAIPANDDSIKSVSTIITILADAIASAKNEPQVLAFQNKEPNLEEQKINRLKRESQQTSYEPKNYNRRESRSYDN